LFRKAPPSSSASFGIAASSFFSKPLPPFPMRTGFPRLGVLRRLRPTRPVRQSMSLSHPGWPVANLGQEPRPDGSRVHCGSLNGVGARLCPSDLITSTPQTFLVTFPERLTQPHRRVLAASVNSETRRARPKSARLESVIRVEGRNNAGSSRTPLHHVRRTRTIWQC
jgi:hypothetical protein